MFGFPRSLRKTFVIGRKLASNHSQFFIIEQIKNELISRASFGDDGRIKRKKNQFRFPTFSLSVHNWCQRHFQFSTNTPTKCEQVFVATISIPSFFFIVFYVNEMFFRWELIRWEQTPNEKWRGSVDTTVYMI